MILFISLCLRNLKLNYTWNTRMEYLYIFDMALKIPALSVEKTIYEYYLPILIHPFCIVP